MTWVISKFMTVPEGAAWVDSLQPGVWWKISDDRKIVTIGGDGKMPVFAEGKSAPWAQYAESIVALNLEGSVTGVDSETFSDLPNLKTLNGLPLTTLADMFGGGAGGGAVVEPTFVKVEDGVARIGLSVCTNADITAETASWGKVEFTEAPAIDTTDPTQIVIPVPAEGVQGFYLFRSKDAAK